MITATHRSPPSPWPTRADKLARRHLRVRVERVSELLPKALQRAAESVEHVHRLRVAIRRAVSALRAYEEWLPRRARRDLARSLRKVRRAAGAARDLDVMLDRIVTSVPELTTVTRLELCHFVAAARGEAQDALRRSARPLRGKRLERRLRRTLDRIRWRGTGAEPSVTEFGRRALAQSVARFVAALPARGTASLNWHQVRIAGKRVRYTIELFIDYLPTDLTQLLLADLIDLQDLLGALHDRQSAILVWEKWCARGVFPSAAGLADAIRGERQRCDHGEREATSRWPEHRLLSLAARVRQLAEAIPG